MKAPIQIQPLHQPVNQIFYLDPWWGREPRARVGARALELNEDEEELLFGESVVVSGHELLMEALDEGRWETLWNALETVSDEEGAGWDLVERLELGPDRHPCPSSGPMLVRMPGRWVWLRGRLRAGKVQKALSIWGVLRHSRREERSR